MTVSKSKKRIITVLFTLILTLACMVSAFASNHADTNFSFNFSGGQPQRTEFRSKQDATNVYMRVNGVAHSFTAHVVGSDSNTNPNPNLGIDCSNGYTYTITQPCTVRMRNWVYDGSHRYAYAAIYAAPSYGYSYNAYGVWSPDSV